MLQSETKDGSDTHYMTSSSSYLRYYASALRSARLHAPSLLPVLVVLNSMPQDYLDWVEAQVRGVVNAASICGMWCGVSAGRAAS